MKWNCEHLTWRLSRTCRGVWRWYVSFWTFFMLYLMPPGWQTDCFSILSDMRKTWISQSNLRPENHTFSDRYLTIGATWTYFILELVNHYPKGFIRDQHQKWVHMPFKVSAVRRWLSHRSLTKTVLNWPCLRTSSFCPSNPYSSIPLRPT